MSLPGSNSFSRFSLPTHGLCDPYPVSKAHKTSLCSPPWSHSSPLCTWFSTRSHALNFLFLKPGNSKHCIDVLCQLFPLPAMIFLTLPFFSPMFKCLLSSSLTRVSVNPSCVTIFYVYHIVLLCFIFIIVFLII